jgi:hypothetical protein
VPFCSRAAEQSEAPTCDVRAMVSAVPIIPVACQPIASAAAFPASGALLR